MRLVYLDRCLEAAQLDAAPGWFQNAQGAQARRRLGSDIPSGAPTIPVALPSGLYRPGALSSTAIVVGRLQEYSQSCARSVGYTGASYLIDSVMNRFRSVMDVNCYLYAYEAPILNSRSSVGRRLEQFARFSDPQHDAQGENMGSVPYVGDQFTPVSDDKLLVKFGDRGVAESTR